jgi:hypothetical protein
MLWDTLAINLSKMYGCRRTSGCLWLGQLFAYLGVLGLIELCSATMVPSLGAKAMPASF